MTKTVEVMLGRLDFESSGYFALTEEAKKATQVFLIDYMKQIQALEGSSKPLSHYLKLAHKWSLQNSQYELCQTVMDIWNPKEIENP